MCTFYMPLAKRDNFFVGKYTAEEYAKQFDNNGFLERMGMDIKLGKVGGVDWDKVWRGLKKSVGLSGTATKGKDEL